MNNIENQSKIWESGFGNSYNQRNNKPDYYIKNNENLFKKIKIPQMENINSAIELGCGYGFSLLGLKNVFPNINLFGVEINADACKNAKNNNIHVFEENVIDFKSSVQYDVVLNKGIMMYFDNKEIIEIYKLIYNLSSKFIIIAEYFNPTAIESFHREIKFYKRDYCHDLMEMFPTLKLVNYGFVYHKDEFPQDDVNWFLLQK